MQNYTIELKSLKPTLYWITGLSGAGKTTIGSMFSRLLNSSSQPTVFLDGDELRRIYAQKATDRSTRLELGYRNLRLCQSLLDQGFNVVLSAIGMYQELFEYAKINSSSSCLIFLDVPLKELVRRDSKGIYSRAESGQLTNVAGFDMQVDLPKSDVKITWNDELDSKNTLDLLISELKSKMFII